MHFSLKNNGKVDKRDRVTTTTFGKIIDYEYIPSSKDWRTGSGRLHVITMFETVKQRRNPNPPPPKVTRQAFKWEISVGAEGFTIHDKQAGDQPFPGTMDFSVPMKTRVELLGFEHKLWAEGNAISIDKVYHAGNNFDPANWDDPNVWTLIPKTGGGPLKKFQGMYDVDQDSCIDLMFVPYKRNPPSDPPIPINMSELSAPPFYCLGRCKNPPIINTK